VFGFSFEVMSVIECITGCLFPVDATVKEPYTKHGNCNGCVTSWS
jgi:hypothetical protein